MSEPALPPPPPPAPPDRPAPGGSNNPRRSNNPRVALHDTVGAVFLGLVCLVLSLALWHCAVDRRRRDRHWGDHRR
jgi:hypothetical protein